MPTVPRYVGPQIDEAPLRGGNLQAPDTRLSGTTSIANGLAGLSDAVDKIQLAQDSQAAFAAETAVKSKWLATDAELRQKYRGANVAGYQEEVAKFWDTARTDQAETLSPRAQKLITQSLGTAKLQAQAGAQHYFTQETERSQDEAFNASQLAEIQRASASGDPAVAATSSKLIRDRNAQQAAIRGWSPEVLDQQNMKATTALHTNMIQDLQQTDPTAAQAYFTANKGEIDGTRHAEIGHALTVASAANDGDKLATDVWNAQGPKGYNDPIALDKMEEAIRAKYPNDAERRKAAMGALRERASAFNASQSEANASAVNTVMGVYNDTRSLAKMKQSPAWSAMPATKQAEVENHITNMQLATLQRANAADARADSAEARAQRKLQRDGFGAYMAYGNVETLSAMSENQVQALLPVLGNELTNHLMEKKRSLGKAADKIVEAKMDQDDFNHVATDMKLDPFDAKTPEKKAALGELKYRVENLINAAQGQKGKALTREEKMELMRGEMSRTVTTGGLFGTTLFADSKPVIQLSKDDVASVVVPDVDKGQIADALKTMYVRDPKNPLYAPTDANVRRLYLMSKSRAASMLPTEK